MAPKQQEYRPLIEVLYVPDCPHYQGVLALVERVRAELGVDAELRTSLIGDQETAERVRFPGSPRSGSTTPTSSPAARRPACPRSPVGCTATRIALRAGQPNAGFATPC
jgi:hypothetical protein